MSNCRTDPSASTAPPPDCRTKPSATTVVTGNLRDAVNPDRPRRPRPTRNLLALAHGGRRCPHCERSRHHGSRAPSHPISRRRPDAAEPDLRLRAARPQSHDGRVVVIVDLKIAGPDVEGDELAVVVGAKQRPHPAVEELRSEPGQFLRSPVWIEGGHDMPPGGSSLVPSISPG